VYDRTGMHYCYYGGVDSYDYSPFAPFTARRSIPRPQYEALDDRE
jgi:hypothetical protein